MKTKKTLISVFTLCTALSTGIACNRKQILQTLKTSTKRQLLYRIGTESSERF